MRQLQMTHKGEPTELPAAPAAHPQDAIWPRVLVIGGGYEPDCMERHVVETLMRMGCPTRFVNTTIGSGRMGATGTAVIYRFARVLVREPERLAERNILEQISRFAPSLILVIQGNSLSPKTVAAIRARSQAAIACWCQDQISVLGRAYLLGAGYDAVFVKDRYMQDLFSRMIRSSSFFYLPEACNPEVHRPLEITAEDRQRYGCDVLLLGSLYYYRHEILRQLEEFDLKLWGYVPSWLINRLAGRHMGGDLVLEKKARAVRSAHIALNPLHYAEIDGLNCRAFELAGCGAFQMVTSRPVLREHFVPGMEVETFDSTDELVDKIRHYLKNPHLAAAIAERGQVRAHTEHTYEARLKEILRVCLHL